MLKNKLKNKKNLVGFTLVELLVVIFIIVLLSGLSLAGYKSHQKNNTLVLVAQQLMSDLNYARNLTLSGQKPDDCFVNNCSWYGLRISTDGYTLYNFGNNFDFKVVKLPSNIQLSSSSSNLYFKYIASNTIQISLEVTSSCPVNIVLTLDDSQKNVIVQCNGQIVLN